MMEGKLRLHVVGFSNNHFLTWIALCTSKSLVFTLHMKKIDIWIHKSQRKFSHSSITAGLLRFFFYSLSIALESVNSVYWSHVVEKAGMSGQEDDNNEIFPKLTLERKIQPNYFGLKALHPMESSTMHWRQEIKDPVGFTI